MREDRQIAVVFKQRNPLFRLLIRYVRHKLHQHIRRVAECAKRLSFDIVAERRRIQDFRARIQRDRISLLCAVGARLLQMLVIGIAMKLLHARCTMRGTVQRCDPIGVRHVQHGLHFFIGLRTVINAVDKVRMHVRQALYLLHVPNDSILHFIQYSMILFGCHPLCARLFINLHGTI